MAKDLKITVEEANEEFLLPLKGLLSWRCGSADFKAKVAKLEREVRRAVNNELGLLISKEEKLIRLVNAERTRAQQAKENFVPTNEILDLQEECGTLKKESYQKEIVVKSELIKKSDLPVAEEVEKESGYSYSSNDTESGQRVYKQFSPNTLVGLLMGVFIID